MSKPMDDEEVKHELNKMVAFIRQEAEEKSRELRLKSDEEYKNEKSKIINQELKHLNSQYEKKEKQALTSRKIAQSTQTNKSRLRILTARDEKLNELFDEVKNKVETLSQSNEYSGILSNLIIQGLLSLLESQIIVYGRKKDSDILNSILEDVKSQYKEISGRDVDLQLSLNLDDTFGGVKLSGFGGRISIDNTIEARLNLLESKMLPEIRNDLFGPNPNRKFNN